MSHPVVTFDTTEKVSTIVHVLKTERHDGFPVVQRDDENVCRPAHFSHRRILFSAKLVLAIVSLSVCLSRPGTN